jgi:hypothetical protein
MSNLFVSIALIVILGLLIGIPIIGVLLRTKNIIETEQKQNEKK